MPAPLPPLFNFRDLAGLPAASNARIQPGRLFRSGDITLLPDDGVAALKNATQLHTYVDFRTRAEAHRDGEPGSFLRAGIAWRRQSVDPKDEVFSRLRSPRHEDWSRFYSAIFQRHLDTWVGLVDFVGTAPGPVLMACSAGKDRTGIATALILTLLGTPRDAILEDFSRTSAAIRLELHRFEHLWRHGQDQEQAIATFLTAAPDILAGFLDAVEQDQGGVERALSRAGLTSQHIQRLHARLLTP